MLKNNRKEFNLLEFIKDRLIISTEGLIKDALEALAIKGNSAFELEKRGLEAEIKKIQDKVEGANNKQDKSKRKSSKDKLKNKDKKLQIGKGKNTKEAKVKKREKDDEKTKQYDQLINMLRLIKNFVDSCYRPF